MKTNTLKEKIENFGWNPVTDSVFVYWNGYETHLVAPLDILVQDVESWPDVVFTTQDGSTVRVPICHIESCSYSDNCLSIDIYRE